jgi:hypothetical protein
MVLDQAILSFYRVIWQAPYWRKGMVWSRQNLGWFP